MLQPTSLANEWIHYYVARLRAVLADEAVTDRDLRRWLTETVEDLADFAVRQHPLDAPTCAAAERVAAADHAFVFHDAPDPEELR
jgi:hypothetical protein